MRLVSNRDARLSKGAAICRAIGVSLLAFALGGTATSSAEITPWVPIRTDDGLIRIQSSIGGIPGYSIIDTGAEMNAINDRFLAANDLSFRRNGKRVKVVGVVASESKRAYEPISATVFESTTEFRNLVGLDLGDPERQLLLGAGFLSLAICQFDYPNGRMRLMSRDSVNLRSVRNIDTRVDRKGGSPQVRVRLNDETNVWLTMDTGSAGGLLLDRRVPLREGWLQRFPVESLEIRGANASGTVESFRLPKISFGPYNLENVAVQLPARGEAFSVFRRAVTIGSRIPKSRSLGSGLLGYDVLKHFVVTVDYKTAAVHIATEPSP